MFKVRDHTDTEVVLVLVGFSTVHLDTAMHSRFLSYVDH